MLETLVNVYPEKVVTVKLNIAQEVHLPGGIVVKMKPIMNGDGNKGTKISVFSPHTGIFRTKRVHRVTHCQIGNQWYGVRNDKLLVRDSWNWTFSDNNRSERTLLQIHFNVEAGRNYGTIEFHYVKSLI